MVRCGTFFEGCIFSSSMDGSGCSRVFPLLLTLGRAAQAALDKPGPPAEPGAQSPEAVSSLGTVTTSAQAPATQDTAHRRAVG
jgi:hypothetical protein